MKKILLTAIFVLSAVSGVFAYDLVHKDYREQFSSPEVNQNYYKTQVDTIKYFDRQTSEVNGLVESFAGTSNLSYDLFSRSFILGKGGAMDTESFTYDGAIAALAYLASGQPKKAALILEVYQTEFYIEKNSSPQGLYNAYRTDKMAKKWGIPPGVDGDRIHLGPNTWVAIAALQYTAITGKTEFLPLAIDIAIWAGNLARYKFADGSLGAASMGFGWSPPDWSVIFSTENVVDHYAVLKMLKDLYETSGEGFKVAEIFKKSNYTVEQIEADMTAIERWLMEVIFDETKKTFNVGSNENGVDKVDALDTVSWTIPALGPERLKQLGADPFHLMDFADDNYYVSDKVENERVYGYDFTNYAGRRKNYRMVWFEGTGFHIIAAQVMADYAKSVGDEEKVKLYTEYSIFFNDEMAKAAALIAAPHNALPYTSKKPQEKQIFTTFAESWEIPRGKNGQWVTSASSTGWRILAQTAFDPLGFNKQAINYRIFSPKK
jgi:hypothetical protein